jgi:hypothetical protein
MKNLISFAALSFAVILAVVYPLVTPFPAVDLDVYLRAANGDISDYFYAPWSLYPFELMRFLPYEVIRIIINLVTILGLWLACRSFNGSVPVVMTSYALMFSFYYGQIEGLWAIGLVLMVTGLKRKSHALAVFGWMIVLAKYYIGIPLGLGLLWCFADFKQARTVVFFTGLALIATFLIYGFWPLDVLQRMAARPPNRLSAIDTWQYFGPVVLLLWIPVIWTRNRSYTIFAATWALTTPYIQPHSLTHMLVTAGPIGVVEHIGYVIGWDKNLVLLQISSLLIYLSPLYPRLRMWLVSIPPFSRWSSRHPAPSS